MFQTDSPSRSPWTRTLARIAVASLAATGASSFAPPAPIETTWRLEATSRRAAVAAALLLPTAAFADEYGRETEAPTLFTGETIMICKRRGPLGACLETVERTAENDNDKASKYFREPTDLVKRKEAEARDAGDDGNALIARLKRQSEENKERNEQLIQQKTFENDQSASFGPFDRQVLIVNANGQGFTLLENPQAMRLKKAGFIKDRKFVTQPTQEQIDAASVSDSPGFFQSFFGGGE